MTAPSPRARALIEALHEPTSNEERWALAQRFLDEERDEAIAAAIPPGTTISVHAGAVVAPTEGE